MNTNVPVVVIYRGGHGVLALARSLGRLGIKTYLIAQEGTTSPIMRSRYWVKTWSWDFAAPEEETLQFLLDVGGQFDTRPVLLTFADWVAIFIEEHAGRLEEWFRFPKAEVPVVRALADKWQMYLLAKKFGIPAPETAFPKSRDEVAAFLQNARFPVVIKDADAFFINRSSKEIVHTPEDVMDRYESAAACGPANLILQEYIPGDTECGWMCNAYFGRGSYCYGIFTAKKLRQVSSTGISSLAVCLPNPTVQEQTLRLMQGVGYEGACGVGYRYDARDGQYKIHDVNPRVSGVLRLFRATNGMDVARMCYLDLTGQPVPASTVADGRKWMLEDDVFSALAAARAGRLTFTQWLKSMRGVKETHWFAPDDPAPGVAWFLSVVRRELVRRWRHHWRSDFQHDLLMRA